MLSSPVGQTARMGRTARTKGHNFERLIAAVFRDVYGPEVRRGHQARAGHDQPDVVLPAGAGLWLECKRHRVVNIPDALAQALSDLSKSSSHNPDNDIPVAVTKSDRKPEIVSVYLEDFIKLLRAAIKGGFPNG